MTQFHDVTHKSVFAAADSGLGEGSFAASEAESVSPELGGPLQQFLRAINPINTAEWSDMGYVRKFYEIFKVRLHTYLYTP